MKKIILSSILVFFSFELAGAAQNAIQIQGADTLILLSQRWAQIYRQRQPNATISIRGGGVTRGLKDLNSGRGTIVQLEGDKPRSGISFPVGVEGIAVYVNKQNPVSQLTLEQLKAVFLGEIINWKQLGGPNRKILLYAGESSTGVLSYFQEAVLHDEEPYPFVGKASAKELVRLYSDVAMAE